MLAKKTVKVGVNIIDGKKLEEKEISEISVPVIIQGAEGDEIFATCSELEEVVDGLTEAMDKAGLSVKEVQDACNLGLMELLSRRERSQFITRLRTKHNIVSESGGTAKSNLALY